MVALGDTLTTRFGADETVTDTKDLDRAIKWKEDALKVGSDNESDKANLLSSHGDALHTRFTADATETKPASLERAIKLKEQAVEVAPKDSNVHATHLLGLGDTLQTKFESKDIETNADDIHRTIEVKKQAVDLMGNEHATNQAAVLSSLASAYQTRLASDETDTHPHDIDCAIT